MRNSVSRTMFYALLPVLLSPVAALAQTQPLWLTLDEAIDRGLRANLSVLVANARVEESSGQLARRVSASYLPRVGAQAYANLQNRNLRAFGISAPGFPSMVGPFANEYVGFAAQQNIFDLVALRQQRAAALQLDASRRDEDDMRDLIVRSVAAYYLNAQAGAARAAAARSRVDDAEALFALARDRREAGVATGVDVLRAQVQLANERQAWLAAQNEVGQALLALARNIGLEPGVSVELAEPLAFTSAPEPPLAEMVVEALAARADLKSLCAQREAVRAQLDANHARYLPKLSVNGSFGGLGRNLTGMMGTGVVQGQVDFTLFDRDREGERQQLTAQLRRLDEQIADQRRGVEQDVRSAALALETAVAEVSVAQEGVVLARRELTQSRDRFEAGATNNIEVITAQDAVARAQENSILAVSRAADAQRAMERALGGRGRAQALQTEPAAANR